MSTPTRRTRSPCCARAASGHAAAALARRVMNSRRFIRYVGEPSQWQRDREPDGLGDLEVDDEGVLVRPLDRQIAGFCTLEDAINVACCLLELVERVDAGAVIH